MLVVRQFPSAWRTGRTLRFREFQAKDLCPQPKGPPYKDQPGWNKDTLRQFEEGALLLKHKHVQMSLKYDRLEKKTHQQKSFLKTLLEPYHTDFSPGLEMHPLDKCGAVGHFESHPKLVSGRYLLFNQWTFTNPWKDGTIVLGELGRFGACEHQRMTGIPDGFSEPFVKCVDEAFKNPGCQANAGVEGPWDCRLALDSGLANISISEQRDFSDYSIYTFRGTQEHAMFILVIEECGNLCSGHERESRAEE
ncbi:hypothetical protein DER44DRAFT_738132 [Fusarium oxysporum]|nr:hypothetical protein DER44DRAFT_738132 [Fusarium oxysporum]